MLQPFEYDPLEKTKHKFMIQSLVMAGDVDEKDVVRNVISLNRHRYQQGIAQSLSILTCLYTHMYHKVY